MRNFKVERNHMLVVTNHRQDSFQRECLLMPFGRSKERPIIKNLRKMSSEVEKGKNPKVPETQSREEIISSQFRNDLASIGLTPSLDSNYIPSAQTPLAKFLRKFGVSDEIIDAILAGLAEEENEDSVREIIGAAADTPEFNLKGEYLIRAMDLAVDEWRKMNRTDDA
jgi:hypothetical protein